QYWICDIFSLLPLPKRLGLRKPFQAARCKQKCMPEPGKPAVCRQLRQNGRTASETDWTKRKSTAGFVGTHYGQSSGYSRRIVLQGYAEESCSPSAGDRNGDEREPSAKGSPDA